MSKRRKTINRNRRDRRNAKTIKTRKINSIEKTYDYDANDAEIVGTLNIKTIETRNAKGKLHSIGDRPAEVIYKGGQISVKTWYVNGKIHREGKPACIQYREGRIFTKSWYKHDKMHRMDGPAHLFYYDDEEGLHYYWYKNGKNHRDGDLPGYIHVNQSGMIDCVRWVKDHQYHRDGDQPSSIWWSKNGQYELQRWECKYDIHRAVGPAIIRRKGGVIKNKWRIHGKKVRYCDVPEESRLSPAFRQAIRSLPLPVGQTIAYHCMQTWQFEDISYEPEYAMV